NTTKSVNVPPTSTPIVGNYHRSFARTSSRQLPSAPRPRGAHISTSRRGRVLVDRVVVTKDHAVQFGCGSARNEAAEHVLLHRRRVASMRVPVAASPRTAHGEGLPRLEVVGAGGWHSAFALGAFVEHELAERAVAATVDAVR